MNLRHRQPGFVRRRWRSAAGALLLLWLPFAQAIDGNYASPYASQWDASRSAVAVPDETLLGALLLVLNFLIVAGYALRARIRRRRAAA